jgi:branched-chain amino acid transport system ATP-binding protein
MALLSARSVTHRFGGLAALSDFSIDVAQDELVGIIGPNGAGKTTVFNLITGIYRPSQGELSFGGQSIVGMRPNQIAGLGIARTFQNIRLFKDLSVLDNVRVAHYPDARYGPLEALSRLGRLDAEEGRIAERSLELLTLFKLDTFALAPSRSLPYGFQRRLEIARALALRPTLLLLDEPAAGMNRVETLELMDFIRWVKREFSLTILLIEHQMDFVMGICERLLVLDFGVTIATGRPDEIRKNPRVLESYLGQEVPGAHP